MEQLGAGAPLLLEWEPRRAEAQRGRGGSGVSWRGQSLRDTGTAADLGLGKSASVNPGNRRGGDSAELARPQEKRLLSASSGK